MANITGGAYLHINADEANLDQVAEALRTISVFGHEIEQGLSVRSNRANFIRQRRAEGYAQIDQLRQSIDPAILESPDYAAMYWSAKIINLNDGLAI